MEKNRPVWAEINLKNIIHNYREVRRIIDPHVQVMAIVKANAYGHGAIEVARSLSSAGVDKFGVALMNEAVQLRKAGIDKPILILGWTPVDDYARALKHQITLTLFSLKEAQALSQLALEKNQKATVHIKLDTGMGRIGFQADQPGLQQVGEILKLPGLDVEGIFTHFAKADENDKSYTRKQLEIYLDFVTNLEKSTGFRFKIKHAANSAAIIDYPQAHLDLVRPGIILYGLKPSDEVDMSKVELRQAMALRARVSHVKQVPPGCSISYGGKFVTREPSVIATLPLGYADGYSRLLSGKAQVLCKGEKAPVVGRICMDQLMLDATHLKGGVKQGDTVTLIGWDQDSSISVDEIAELLGTINYEVVCMVTARVPRLHFSIPSNSLCSGNCQQGLETGCSEKCQPG
ncbi:MAG: alanine racemase [Bacillota bacterium]|uniref:Alanine racemase n=1 Tax=Thermanaerosceptrum fracticalcis TaxID=1712410 RepID=A0A7G6E8G8_THEFR|nr:alanine racemase [Thermanaerosceptrum fracticalcis]QNB48372.1 alanine racemase [Thermanaerosceptrum fracticalcis]